MIYHGGSKKLKNKIKNMLLIILIIIIITIFYKVGIIKFIIKEIIPSTILLIYLLININYYEDYPSNNKINLYLYDENSEDFKQQCFKYLNNDKYNKYLIAYYICKYYYKLDYERKTK